MLSPTGALEEEVVLRLEVGVLTGRTVFEAEGSGIDLFAECARGVSTGSVFTFGADRDGFGVDGRTPSEAEGAGPACEEETGTLEEDFEGEWEPPVFLGVGRGRVEGSRDGF